MIIALFMKKTFIFIFLIPFVLSGCKKDETPSGSGTVTIDNTLSGNYQTGYYAYGFLFSQAKKVSTIGDPGPDITIDVDASSPPNRLYFQTDNFNPSFYKVGDYPDAQAAVSAFNNLKTVGTYQWEDIAVPVNDNQVWVFRTGSECYAKIRIITTVNDSIDNRPHGECSFEWVYQPDGSVTFPVK
jgi:hypothetical protein